MYLISQYYNKNGKIVTAAPGMDTREFYQNLAGKHTFNEMFRAANLDLGIGYKITESGFYFYTSGEPGIVKPKYTERDTTSVWNNETSQEDEYYISTRGSIQSVMAGDGNIVAQVGGLRHLEIIVPNENMIDLSHVRFGFEAMGYGCQASIYLEIRNQDVQNNFSEFYFGTGWSTKKYAEQLTVRLQTSLSEGISRMKMYNENSEYYMSDYKWHKYILEVVYNNYFRFLIDGVLIHEENFSDYGEIHSGEQTLTFQAATVEDDDVLFIKNAFVESL